MVDSLKISIVIPVYNGEKYIQDTIESIFNQKYPNFEIIVMDGGSTDSTLEIVSKFDDIIVHSQKDSGQSDAINNGFKIATGDILAWQNADDLYLPDTFNKVASIFNRDQDLGIIYGNYQFIDEDGNWICDVFPRLWNSWLFKHGRFCPVQPVVFWRKGVWDEVGPLDESLNFCMDVDFYSGALKSGYKFQKVNEMFGQFRKHELSKTQNENNFRDHKKEYKDVLSKHFDYSIFDSLIFEGFYYRSKLTSYLKQNFFKKIRPLNTK